MREANAEERQTAKSYVRPVWDEFGEPDSILWTNVVERDADPAETLPCLWDFVRLTENTAERLPGFVRRWGLLDWAADSSAAGTEHEQPISDWHEAAEEVDRLLRAFAITEQGELVPENLLWQLRDGDRRDYYSLPIAESWGRPNAHAEAYMAALKRQHEYFQSERRGGRGVALQRELIMHLMGEVALRPDARDVARDPAVPLLFAFSWDEKGRRIEAMAYGVREIVASHLFSIFAATHPDVFICSVCESLFSTETSGTQRRPRAGFRQLCSDACRVVAKRESNRSSWRKNRDRWRPSGAIGGKRVTKEGER